MTMSTSKTTVYRQQAEHLKVQGRLDEAAVVYNKALELDSNSLDLWWALGDICAQLEDFGCVERCCRAMIAINPAIPEVHLYLGMALQRQDKLEMAQSALQTALKLNPNLSEACYQLGVVQQALDLVDAAIASYTRALPVVADPAPVLFNLSLLLCRQGRLEEAFEHACKALQAGSGSLKYRRNFVWLLRMLSPRTVSDALMDEILKCFRTTGLDVTPLTKPCMLILSLEPEMGRTLALANSTAGEKLGAEIAAGTVKSLFSNELFRQLLLHTKITSPEVEALLCMLRHLLLDASLAQGQVALSSFAGINNGFVDALACQFFTTEYAALETTRESVAVDKLIASLHREVAQDAQPNQDFCLKLAVACMYRPLSALNHVERLIAHGSKALSDSLPVMIERQWKNHQVESELCKRIETLTTVDGDTSMAVRRQYEESPYPRWISVDLPDPLSVQELLRMQFPYFEPPGFETRQVEILSAGCGTGRMAITLAAHIANSEVLAVDLSRASLAYARRQAEAAGLTNIRFAQADILKIKLPARDFHVIECSGVLHHMQDPLAGLKSLTGSLADKGLMRLGLYSASGRRAVTAARELIAQRGFNPTPDGIRAARHELLQLGSGHPAFAVTRFLDFYTMSECRDLLFHVQESCLTIPDIARLLETCGLRFIGFAFAGTRVQGVYKERYPDDPAMTNLENWHDFEQHRPDTFEEMYQFWCQKS